jgi:hypothetical protein
MTGGNTFPWSHPFVVSAALIFAGASFVLYNVEKHATKPILPLDLFLKFPLGNLVLTGFLFSMVNYTVCSWSLTHL